jgi:predicted nucleic acid-binding Zn ribbon protein
VSKKRKDKKMKPTVVDVKHQIETHEAVCAERWLETVNRIKRLENGAMVAATGVFGLLITIIFMLIER